MKKNTFTVFVCLLLIILFNLPFQVIGQFAQQPPFKISIEAITNANPANGYHSFAFAQLGSKWLIIGGRTNGLHGLNANDPFPQEFANNNVVVIDTTNWQNFYSSLSNLPKPIADPLRSSNMQYVQHGDYLYIVGGYGRDSVLNRFVTFPTVTRVRVDSIIDAVINNTPIQSYIKQLSDTNLRVCGGELHFFNNQFYLVFGHDFNGRYANPFAPIYTQRYTTSIKKFSLIENPGNIQVTNYLEIVDTNNFHRRDLNVLPLIKPNGTEALMAYSGVFQKQHDFPYFEPIFIDTNSYSLINYTQVMSHYTCAALPVFDTTTKKMHTVFLGGISFNDYNPALNTIVQDTNVPFISDVTCFTVNPGNICEEAVMPIQLPGLLGSNAKFVPNANTQWYPNGVLKLNSIGGGKTLAGYLFGGIRADLPNLGNLSVANDTIYRIYIERDTTVAVKQLTNEIAFLEVFPNPAVNKVFIRFHLRENSELSFSLYDSNGLKIKEIKSTEFKKGTANLSLDINELNTGLYLLKCSSTNGTITKKIIVNH